MLGNKVFGDKSVPRGKIGKSAPSTCIAEEALASTDMERPGLSTLPTKQNLSLEAFRLLLPGCPISSAELSSDQGSPSEGNRPCQSDTVVEKPACLLKRSNQILSLCHFYVFCCCFI